MDTLGFKVVFLGQSVLKYEVPLDIYHAINNIYETSQNRRVDMRLAAYMVGVRKMAEASRFRGWI